MAKITQIDRTSARTIQTAFSQFLKTFGQDLGIVGSIGSGRFDSRSIRFKVELSLADTSTLVDKSKNDFEFYCSRFGLSKDDWGKRFLSRGKSYTICGIKPSSYKYPILGKNPKGVVYKFTSNNVLVGMGKKTIASDFEEDEERDFGTPRED